MTKNRIHEDDAREQFDGCYDEVPTYEEWLDANARGLEAVGADDEWPLPEYKPNHDGGFPF